jgi:DnaK suppressor protein
VDERRARELLVAERARVEAELDEYRTQLDRSGDEDTGELAAVDQHQADTGTETYYREDAVGRIEQLERELEAVERAERRLADGTYGVSVQSGEPIPDERLEAIPTAERTASEESAWRRAEAAPQGDPADTTTPLDEPGRPPVPLAAIPLDRGNPEPMVDPQEEDDEVDLEGMGGEAYHGEGGAPDVGVEEADDRLVDRRYRPD